MSDLKEDAAKASDAARVVANEAAHLKEDAAAANEAAQAVAGKVAQQAMEAMDLSTLQKAIRVMKRHPLAALAVVAAAASLIEVELALGMLAGIGATALLTPANGAQTRQQVAAKGKWVQERAEELVNSAKIEAAEAVPTPDA